MKTTELKLDRKVVSAREWEAARQQLLVKEKELFRARDALPPTSAHAVVGRGEGVPIRRPPG